MTTKLMRRKKAARDLERIRKRLARAQSIMTVAIIEIGKLHHEMNKKKPEVSKR